MTYKYEEVKREIWERKPDKLLYPRRTLKEIRATISIRFWILFSIAVAGLIASVILFIYGLSEWCIVPLIIDFIVLTISDWLGEKNYNVLPRKAELKKQKEKYKEYINTINKILRNCNIETQDQIECLKIEAKDNISKFENRFNSIRTKMMDLWIAIPLAALLESFWASKTDADPTRIASFIVFGLFGLSTISIIRKIYIHFNVIRKDYYLYQVLLETDYMDYCNSKSKRV